MAPSSSLTTSEVNPINMHDDRQRIRHVFMHLHQLCSTQMAKDSLEEFRIQYMERVFGDNGPHSEGKKAPPKKGVFERLMGKKGAGK